MKGVVERIEGAWEFADNGNGRTSIDSLTCSSRPTPRPVPTIKDKILSRYRGRLENAMNIIKSDLEQGARRNSVPAS